MNSKRYVCFNHFIDKSELKLNFEPVKSPDEADILISLGGDGTLLRFFHKMYNQIKDQIFNKVFMGVNFGTVGFLTVPKNYLNKTEFNLVNRGVLKIDKYNILALNEIVIYPKLRGQLFELSVSIGKSTTYYKGDGLIISTSTGSTAYNLSANGPIVFPEIDCYILSPICPFSLANRPIVVPHTYNIKVTSEDVALVYYDGRFGFEAYELNITYCNNKLKMVTNTDFQELIRKKLGWNKQIKET